MTRMDRRRFLRQSSMTVAMGTTGAWLGNLASINNASAQASTTDYKALVCIFLAGGNDGHNTIVPTDAFSWRTYSATRDPAVMAQMTGQPQPDNAVSLALPQSSLLPIGHRNAKGLNTGRTFGLNPHLRKIQQLYTQNQAAVVANIGPLLQPTSKLSLTDQSFAIPRKLYSHNDQVSTWQSFGPEGMTGGWGGMLMDTLSTRNVNSAFGSVGVGANAVWLNGKKVIPYLLGNNGLTVMGGTTSAILGSTDLYLAARAIATTSTRSDVIVKDLVDVGQSALKSETALRQSMPQQFMAPWGTPGSANASGDPLLQYTDPGTGKVALNPLAQQLQTVARMISARNHNAIGARRQVFMVTLGGFDTHGDQMRLHASLMAKLDHAVDFFQRCLSQMPDGDVRSQVTTFTASEFGRALVSNGDGTDHGWGSHHFVIGGAVKGGDIYGRFPQFMAFDGNGGFFSDQLLTAGVLLPELSVDHLVYTLGKWMGAADADLVGPVTGGGIAPNIRNFPAEGRNIGFMA